MIAIDSQVRAYLLLHRKILNMKGLAYSANIPIKSLMSFINDGRSYSNNERRKMIADKVGQVLEKLTFFRGNTPAFFKNIVVQYFNTTTAVLEAKTRKKTSVEIRQIAHFLAVEHKKYIEENYPDQAASIYSLNDIGKEIGNVDHATVLHSYKTILHLVEVDKIYADLITDIKRLYSR